MDSMILCEDITSLMGLDRVGWVRNGNLNLFLILLIMKPKMRTGSLRTPLSAGSLHLKEVSLTLLKEEEMVRSIFWSSTFSA